MAKQTGKNAIILIGGYALSTYASAYSVEQQITPVDVTGFTDESRNYLPGLATAKMSTDMMWSTSAGTVHAALGAAAGSGIVTLAPEGYTLGAPSLSMPYLQTTYTPKSAPDARIDVGTIDFESYGNNAGVENGVMLAHGTVANTTTGTGVDDPTGAAVTASCAAALHIWTACAADTYVVKVQHSANNSTWADLMTFSADGSVITSERRAVASGTINRYRRVLATRTGAAANPFGFSVHFYHS